VRRSKPKEGKTHPVGVRSSSLDGNQTVGRCVTD
jgi:hypothetical protein